MQQEIQNAAYEYQQAVDRTEAIVVGVNAFELEEEKPMPLQRIDESLERKQVERLRALRAKRDHGKVAGRVQQVEDTARGGGNLMPPSSKRSKPTPPSAKSPMPCAGCLASTTRRW